jgi:hypothetical protein
VKVAAVTAGWGCQGACTYVVCASLTAVSLLLFLRLLLFLGVLLCVLQR